jgi:hypothetical protein
MKVDIFKLIRHTIWRSILDEEANHLRRFLHLDLKTAAGS